MHLVISIIFIFFAFISCYKRARLVDIKLLILTPDVYYGYPVVLTGKIREIGLSGLWFIIEDKTGYIQVTTENIPSEIPCIKKGNEISLLGKLTRFENHKYFSFSSLVRCGN